MSTPRTMKPGAKITTGSELVNAVRAGSYFYFDHWRSGPGRPKHAAFIRSMTLHTLMGYMDAGCLLVARKIKTREGK